MVEYSPLASEAPSAESAASKMQDWRQAIKLPTAYRIGNSTVRLQYQFVLAVTILGVLALGLFYRSPFHSSPKGARFALEKRYPPNRDYQDPFRVDGDRPRPYNSTYPFTLPVRTDRGLRYRVAIIADLDTGSKRGEEWVSYLKTGHLYVDLEHQKVAVEWDEGEPVTLKSSLAQGGRGMELSELVVFNGNLLAFDDRTGTVYQIEGKNVYPWVLLVDGHGKVSKGFKSEWATVKDHQLWVGGLGKAWTTPTGELVNLHPQYVKRVSLTGEVTHIDWHKRYEALAEAVDIRFPGYLIHESAAWSAVHKKWFFLPRRESKERYDETLDESRGTNLMLVADEDFSNVEARRVGQVVDATHGFSSFKFVPNTRDRLIVALKSQESHGATGSFIMAFDVDGKIVLPETKIDGDFKFEGIEFV